MNKVEFTVARLGAEKTSPNFDSFLNDKIFCDLALRLCGKPDYKVTWTDERNKGRLIKADYKTRDGRRKTFITLSPSGRVKGRNSFFQSVATAFSTYIDYAQKTNARKCNFVFYILPLKGNYQTAYNNFIFKVMNTFGVNILNADAALKNFIVERFVSVRELIGARNSLRNKNAGNKSTYVTDEGKCYNIYGKTFGANSKETVLICLALVSITDKPIKFFQIKDNNSKNIPATDIAAIESFAKGEIEILPDSYEFLSDEQKTRYSEESIRSARFIYNMLSKTGGIKKCALCSCPVENIIQAAHILPVFAIKRLKISRQEQIEMAADGDNGLWLCSNHHKLFDDNIVRLQAGRAKLADSLSAEEKTYINAITTKNKIESSVYTKKMNSFMEKRYETPEYKYE